MTTATITSIIVTLITGLIVALTAIVWFAVTSWIKHVDGLQVSIESLRATIDAWESKFVTVAQHRQDLRILRQEHALGRRTMDHCPSTTCPFEATSPGLLAVPEEPGL